MSIPLNLTDIQSGFLSASAMNQNNSLIEQALAKAIDRTGDADNAMETDLDMGLNWINNVKDAYLNHQALSFGQGQRIITASGGQVTSTAEKDTFTATAGQTVFNLKNIEYIQGTNSLLVFVNGVYQKVVDDYTESLTTQIEFTSPLVAGDIVVILGARFNAEVFVTEASGFAGAAESSATDAETAATESENWANNPEDVLVPEGDGVDDYSALHWAKKAEADAGYILGITNQTGTTYQLVATDEGNLVRMNNAGDNTVIIPTNATVPFEIGTVIDIRQVGAGVTTVEGASGVTVNAFQNDLSLGETSATAGIVKVGTDEWDFIKSLEFVNSIEPATGGSGFQFFANNLQMKWGRIPIDIDQADITKVTYPTPFTQATINVQVTLEFPGAIDGAVGPLVTNISNTGFDIRPDQSSTTYTGAFAYWIAIGV